MTEDDYTDFSNFAYALRKHAQAFFAQMGDEQVYQLAGFVRNELATCPKGRLEPAYDFLAAILSEEVAERSNPLRNVVKLPKRFENDLPF